MSVFKKYTGPLQYAGAYTLDLYCDHVNSDHIHGEFPHQFIGDNFDDCANQARIKGWYIHRKTRTSTCPTCAKRLSLK